MHCNHCNTEKPSEGFYTSNKTKCKDCIKAAVSAYRQANLEHIRAYDRMRASMPHRIAMNREVTKKYIGNFPKRRAANNAVNNAVRDGLLQRQPCWECGKKAVAHHADYDRPLDVVWLCQVHHKQAHALIKECA